MNELLHKLLDVMLQYNAIDFEKLIPELQEIDAELAHKLNKIFEHRQIRRMTYIKLLKVLDFLKETEDELEP